MTLIVVRRHLVPKFTAPELIDSLFPYLLTSSSPCQRIVNVSPSGTYLHLTPKFRPDAWVGFLIVVPKGALLSN